MQKVYPITAVVQKGRPKVAAEKYTDGPEVTPSGNTAIKTKPGKHLFDNAPESPMATTYQDCGCKKPCNCGE